MMHTARSKGAWLVLGLLLAACSQAARPEHNSYLNEPARSQAELVRQVRTDRVVMDRYMRHFGMSSTQVLELMSSLHVATLESDQLMAVYNCDDAGVLRSRLLKMRAGTYVYADPGGMPVLKLSCGNPFYREAPIHMPEIETISVRQPMKEHDPSEPFEPLTTSDLIEPGFDAVPELPIPIVPHEELIGIEAALPIVPSHDVSIPLLAYLIPTVPLAQKIIPNPSFREPPPDSSVPGPGAALVFAGPTLSGILRRRAGRRSEGHR